MREWSLFTKKNYDLLIFWIKQKNKSTMVLNGTENLYLMISLVLGDIIGWKLLFQTLTRQTRKSIILWHNCERLLNCLV